MAQAPSAKAENQTPSDSTAADSPRQKDEGNLTQSLEKEANLADSPANTSDEDRTPTFSTPRQPESGENRLRPAADILNRIIWDPSFDSSDYIICYEDRFEGRLEAGLISEAMMAQRDKLEKSPARPSMFIEERDDDETISPNLARGLSADPTSVDVVGKSFEEEPMRQTKSQYFEDIFNTRGRELSPKTQDFSVIVAELKLSKKVKDEESLASMISSRLAHIYQKPESSLMVTIQHDVCLRFGISQCPAYLMKVYALPYSIAPITNLRCTILIQSALRELLQIEPNRGVVLYFPVPEENFATNNVTYMDEPPHHARRTEDEDPSILRNISRSLSRRLKSTKEEEEE
ncbi:hypothetical protein BBP40_000425 [Aspergillus hancockii]|nr:hypothetical protein BBP40_000425 [Aspergillus hancockii]